MKDFNKTIKLQPNANTLWQMFGDVTPIGAYSRENFQKDIQTSTNIDDAVKAIIKYAKSLNQEQLEYDMISPFAGEDITVESIEDIAIETSRTINLPIFENISREELENAVYTHLIEEEIETASLLNFISIYQRFSSLDFSKEIDNQIVQYQQEKMNYENQITEKTQELKAIIGEVDKKMVLAKYPELLEIMPIPAEMKFKGFKEFDTTLYSVADGENLKKQACKFVDDKENKEKYTRYSQLLSLIESEREEKIIDENEVVNGYKIIHTIPISDENEIVLGQNIKNPSLFVTWEHKPNSEDYFWGHYHDDKLHAQKDLYDRASGCFSDLIEYNRQQEKKQNQGKVLSNKDNIELEGHIGTWYVVETKTYLGETLYELEHEEYGDEAAHIIVDANLNIKLEDVCNGFDDYDEFLAAQEIKNLSILDNEVTPKNTKNKTKELEM